jgi:hypothetical protein
MRAHVGGGRANDLTRIVVWAQPQDASGSSAGASYLADVLADLLRTSRRGVCSVAAFRSRHAPD